MLKIHFKSQLGLTLLELLIASALSSILMLVLWKLFATATRSFRWIGGQFPSAYETMLIESMLAQSIRQTGFTPCLALDNLVTADEKGNALEAYRINKQGTSLTLNRMGDDYQEVTLLSLTSAQITKRLEPQYQLIADCYHAELLQITHTSKIDEGFQVTFSPLQFSYSPPIYLGQWLSETYSMEQDKGLVYRNDRSDVLSKELTMMHISLLEKNGHDYFKIQFSDNLGKDNTLFVTRRVA